MPEVAKPKSGIESTVGSTKSDADPKPVVDTAAVKSRSDASETKPEANVVKSEPKTSSLAPDLPPVSQD
jgi:hypothetical protein